MKKDLTGIANFLFEVGILSKTPRSGFHFLGSGQQSVAEHVHRTVYVGYVLAKLAGAVDIGKVMQMCLFHDLAETRTSDLNYVHQKYTRSDEHQAIADLAKTLGFGPDVLKILKEMKAEKTKEAQLAKDADALEFLISLKEELDTGNTRAEAWIPYSVKRLKTEVGRLVAEEILTTSSDQWWFGDKEDDWWVQRSDKAMKKRF